MCVGNQFGNVVSLPDIILVGALGRTTCDGSVGSRLEAKSKCYDSEFEDSRVVTRKHSRVVL
eukprot:SAG11_NODE_11_length_27870_cov_16.327428_13_plen_62_part_00